MSNYEDFKNKIIHVGKDLFRAKEHEEDIMIINEIKPKELLEKIIEAYKRQHSQK